MNICRRVEDNPEIKGVVLGFHPKICENCFKEVVVESVLGPEEVNMCLHCAARYKPDAGLFVELPPDEFGHRSTAATVKQVFEKDDGQWHKTGAWHTQQWVFDRLE